MIQKISRLKNFGIFRNFSWDNGIPDFKKFNLIYGWNKSGKTTTSRIFSACEKRSTLFNQYPKDGEFELKTATGSIKHFDCADCPLRIKVFNKDFVDENVSFDPSNSSNPIVYVSEEDIESGKRLKEAREEIKSLSENLSRAQKNTQKDERAEDAFRKTTARTIKDVVGNLKVYDKYRNYDKGALKTAIDTIGIDNFSKVSAADLEKYKKIISSDAKQKQGKFSAYTLNFSFNGKQITTFSEIHQEATRLLEKKIVAETIERLKNDPPLNQWVQTGYDLHRSKKEEKNCLFCQNAISGDFLTTLSKHFSNDYEKLQQDITSFIEELENLKREQFSEKNTDLYTDLQGNYRKQIKDLNDLLNKLNSWTVEITQELRIKFNNLLSEVKSSEKPADFITSYNKIVEDINGIISTHNERVDNHDKEVETAKETLEKHLIAVAIEEQGYKKINEDLDNSVRLEKEARKEFEDIDAEIKKLEKKTSNIGKALQNINKHLVDFFGRKEIHLELDDGKRGYVIKREGATAYNLSESEKNAIAFSYFIVKFQEKGFNLKDGIIFIDDPISSFDLNFIYHCFSLIKNHFKSSAQLFVSTHNFQFFNLIKDWFEQKNRRVESDNKKIADPAVKKPIPCEFFMIENVIENEKRCASIKQLEETLRKFKSEYHFLFARLNQFITEASPNYFDFYSIGNIARRFLEIYVNFKIPTTGDLYSKMRQLETPSVGETEIDKVYQLIQEFSHGVDPSSTIEHKDKSESQEAVKILMKIVEESDHKHFELLKSSI